MVVDEAGRVWPVECNSRYTGAFPMYTMMQINNKEIPLDVWHLLEWLGVDYEMDIDEVQKLGRGEKQGAQLLLHNLERKTVTATKTVKAGMYRIAPQPVRRAQSFATPLDVPSGVSPDILRASVTDGAIQYVRPGFSLLDIKSEDEFVLCDRVAGEESVLKPAERLGRLVFKRQVVDEKGSLLPEIREVVRAVYDRYNLR